MLPKMPLLATKIQPRSLLRLLSTSTTSSESQTQKLNRIADDLVNLTETDHEEFSTLFRLKISLTGWVPPSSLSAIPAAGSAAAAADEPVEEKKEERTAFDIKLEKFDAAAKIKVIKEVRTFTDLGLKEAKELVEKAPVVIKKMVLKEEAEGIVAKLKEIGASAVLE